MGWRFVHDPDDHAAIAGPLLERDPVRNTISLTALAEARARRSSANGGTLYGSWSAPGTGVAGAVFHSPPFDLVAEELPDGAIRSLVEALAERGRSLGGVAGPTAAVAHFAAVWTQRTNCRAILRHAQRLYRLTSLVEPAPPPPGRARVATDEDVDLVVAWIRAFGEEAGTPSPDMRWWAEQRLAAGTVMLWLDQGDAVVSLASRSSVVAGMARIGPVYTPPEHRRHGFAAAVTAAASDAALTAGARDVVLFTDLANATANALYPRLGYRPVDDRLEVELRPRS